MLSKYWVGTWLVGFDKQRSKESVMSISKLLKVEWKEKEES